MHDYRSWHANIYYTDNICMPVATTVMHCSDSSVQNDPGGIRPRGLDGSTIINSGFCIIQSIYSQHCCNVLHTQIWTVHDYSSLDANIYYANDICMRAAFVVMHYSDSGVPNDPEGIQLCGLDGPIVINGGLCIVQSK